jgi:hypothetical protein
MAIHDAVSRWTGAWHRGVGLVLLCGFALSEPALGQQPHQTHTPYLIGRGMVDITGPPVGMPLWGFGRPDQISEGIHYPPAVARVHYRAGQR